jgi:predicted unusual protein kinase regulating ubiquinone biosynthesis (AarF/ABC1/UbiB family)
MWLTGVAHADLHSSNVMYDDVSRKLTIIDFGRAVLLSSEAIQSLRQQLLDFASSSNLKKQLLRPDALKMISKKVVVDTTDITHRQIGIKRYLDDEAMIQHHIARRCLKPTCTPEALAKERLTTWVPKV